MATTASSARTPVASTPANTTESVPFIVRMEKYRKPISYGLGVLAFLVVGYWLYSETGRRKQTAAADALDGARATFEAGNLPSASTEFQAVIQRFGGTDAAYQAQLGLNAVRLASGQAQLAADELEKFARSNPPAYFQAGAWLLAGTALENAGKFDSAAAAYTKASEVAPEDYRKVEALLGASRAYGLAGKQKERLDALRQIVSKFPEDTPGVAEAKVRLAEATGGTG